MIKGKRLNNLKLLKEKNLNKVTMEINTLNNEVKKSNDLASKLKKIKNNSQINQKYNNSMDMMYKYEFERKIIEQISICENRVLFLKNELIRAKNKLGKMVSQKKLIEEKIKFTFLKELQLKESKLTRDTPPFRKN
ncbi:MAG: hypothetical protein CMJ06_05925 [Pelagibacterales bacterium]|nr:hypothetical protein [Pelagibacterales bacterium]OUU61172.1 MAG: hypothetical protein CBC22_08070 [Alphaproteobacteria bacterium TMED62]|tara:strand:+ start:3309 stop:3716 length:408 start_codon:yes stop_codon:yes gene_type:complete